MTRKLTLNALLRRINPEKQLVCIAIMQDFANEFETFPGSVSKHQWWRGGYRDHVEEVMNIAIVLFGTLNKKRRVTFSLSDALFILFIHDLDKLIDYKRTKGKVRRIKRHGEVNISKLLEEKYHFRLSKIERNAIKYIHGENEDYHPRKRIMLPLTVFVHCCDILSARLWYDKGRSERIW